MVGMRCLFLKIRVQDVKILYGFFSSFKLLGILFKGVWGYPNFFNLVELEGWDLLNYFSFFEDFASSLLFCNAFVFINKVKISF